MAGRSSIETHAQREAIERAIRGGTPGAVIARTYGVSESAVSRHRKMRMVTSDQVSEPGEADEADVMQRVVDLADSARRARQMADVNGAPAAKARAQSAELSVLNVLLDKLGVTNLTPVYLSSMAAALYRVLVAVVDDHPQTRADVLAKMRQHNALHELADSLAETPRSTR